MASSLMEDGRFRTALKCSAHRSKILARSVMSVFPSALRSGEDLKACGPQRAFRAS